MSKRPDAKSFWGVGRLRSSGFGKIVGFEKEENICIVFFRGFVIRVNLAL